MTYVAMVIAAVVLGLLAASIFSKVFRSFLGEAMSWLGAFLTIFVLCYPAFLVVIGFMIPGLHEIVDVSKGMPSKDLIILMLIPVGVGITVMVGEALAAQYSNNLIKVTSNLVIDVVWAMILLAATGWYASRHALPAYLFAAALVAFINGIVSPIASVVAAWNKNPMQPQTK